MEKITNEQMIILRNLINGHNTIRYGILQSDVHQTVENHTNRMLVLAPVIAEKVGLKLDKNYLNAMIILHDLPELGMKQDITNVEQVEQQGAKQRKDELEKKVKINLAQTHGKWMLDMFNEYEEQLSELTRFVKWLDKYEASRHMLEIDLFSEIPLKNFSVNTMQLVDKAIKIPLVIPITLKHLENELYLIWKRNNQLKEFEELKKKLK